MEQRKSLELQHRASKCDGQVVPLESSYTPEEEKRLVRKIDCFVLPLLCLVFFLQYLDKQSLSYAAVFGLIPDLNLSGEQYSWCSSIFYIGQLVSEYPFIYLMSRLPLAKFIAITIEGAVSPAFVTITSIWYRKKEHPLRVGAWITMNGMAQVVGSLMMYGIGHNKSLALASWRVLFLVCGGVTVASGIAFFFMMPSSPEKAWFFTKREREIIAERMLQDREGGDQTKFSWRQAKEAMTEQRAILVFVFGVLATMQSPVLTFASLIISNLNYDKFETMLFTSPSGAVQVAFIWIGMLGCALLPRNRCLVVILLSIPPLIGNILLLKLPLSAGWGMIVSSWLASCISDVMAILLSLSASNNKGNTKRAMVNTYYFIGYCVGCIAAPQLWKTPNAPRFFEGVVTAIVTWCLLIGVMCWYWYICAKENARRDEFADTQVATTEHGLDITDKEDLSFRYNY